MGTRLAGTTLPASPLQVLLFWFQRITNERPVKLRPMGWGEYGINLNKARPFNLAGRNLVRKGSR